MAVDSADSANIDSDVHVKGDLISDDQIDALAADHPILSMCQTEPRSPSGDVARDART